MNIEPTSVNILGNLIGALTREDIMIVDLTHVLSSDFPVIVLPDEFAQCEPFKKETVSKYNSKGPAWYWNKITMNEHTGTHFDAPIHWITGKDIPNNSVDKIPLKNFIGPAVVLDFSKECTANDDFILTREHIIKWEAIYGPVPKNHWILFRTGWNVHVGTERYLNLREDGQHSPGPDASAMEYLVIDRDCIGMGVETIGTDAGQASNFDPPLPAHSILHGNGRFGLQCLANLDKLPIFGSVIIAAPLKIEEGSGSPLRVMALVQK